jgi:hypothetical protein
MTFLCVGRSSSRRDPHSRNPTDGSRKRYPLWFLILTSSFLVLGLSSPTEAVVVTFDFSGSIILVDDSPDLPLTGFISLLDSFSGRLTYEAGASDGLPLDAIAGRYQFFSPPADLSVTINGLDYRIDKGASPSLEARTENFTVIGAPLSTFDVGNSHSKAPEVFLSSALFPPEISLEFNTIRLEFADGFPPSPLKGDALPEELFVDDWDRRVLVLQASGRESGKDWVVLGVVDRIEQVSVSQSPSIVLVPLGGAVMLLALRRVRKKHRA